MKLKLSTKYKTIIHYSFVGLFSLAILIMAACYTGKNEITLVKCLFVGLLFFAIHQVLNEFEVYSKITQKIIKSIIHYT